MIPKSENACTRVRDSGWQNLYSQSMSVTGDYYVSVLLCMLCDLAIVDEVNHS